MSNIFKKKYNPNCCPMTSNNFIEGFNPDHCPIRNLLNRFSDKWSILIITLYKEQDTYRFSELQKRVGSISQKVLTSTLRSLEADGLIRRKVYPEIPPKVEYSLTDMGKSLIPLIYTLFDWAKEHNQKILEAREEFEQKQK